MGSIGQIELNKLEFKGQDIQTLRELFFLTVLQKNSLDSLVEIKTGIYDGSKIGAIGRMGMVGKNQPICNPTYNGTNLSVSLNKWELGNFSIAEQMCADDYKGTIAELSMRKGTNAGDFLGTELLNNVIFPKLEEAIDDGIWRYLFFGDTTAANLSDQGNIKDGLDLDFFNSTDGFFKRLFLAIPPTIGSRYVKIKANSAATKEKQNSEIKLDGVATKIFDDLIDGSDLRLRTGKDKRILCTISLFDALVADLQRNNKGSEAQWNSLFDGIGRATFTTVYKGIEIIGIPAWDDMIQSYESAYASDGTTEIFNKPHRAIFARKDMLWAGVNTKDILLPDLIVFHDQVTSLTHIRGNNELGTVLVEADMISMAY